MERRTLVRLLIVLAIGIPLLVEAVTVLGFVETRFLGGEDGIGTPSAEGVGVGDELIAETRPTETVTESVVRDGSPPLFVLRVEVENPLDVPYELRLGTVTLTSGDTVPGEASTGRVPAGGSGEVTGAWELPEGGAPASVAVRAITYRADGPTETTSEVTLAPVRAE